MLQSSLLVGFLITSCAIKVTTEILIIIYIMYNVFTVISCNQTTNQQNYSLMQKNISTSRPPPPNIILNNKYYRIMELFDFYTWKQVVTNLKIENLFGSLSLL